MLDILIQIPGSTFLGYFLFFSILCIGTAKIWMYAADDSKQYRLPSFTKLNPFEIAALRNGRKGVIQTALFELWHRKLITTRGKAHLAEIRKVNLATTKERPKNEIEQNIYNFAHITRKPGDFFSDTTLRSNIDKHLKPINQRLEQLHLKQTDSQIKRAWKNLWLVLFLILGIGGTKLYFGFYYGHPVFFLIILLLIIPFITFKILAPKPKTQLGNEYLQKLQKHFEWTISEENLDIDQAFRVSIFGVTALTSFVAFSAFENAFSESDSPGNSLNGGCGGGGCGGGGGGCGGGCGGCGG